MVATDRVRFLFADALEMLDQRLRPYDVTPIQWAIMVRLYSGQANTAAGLVQLIPVDRAHVNRQVEILARRELIDRRQSVADRRIYLLRLTEAGEELMPALIEQAKAVDAIMFAGISEDDRATFLRVVREILANSA